MSRNFRPPPPRGPPRQQQPPPPQPKYKTTIDSLFESQKRNDTMTNSSLNDIDDDDENTEISSISDNDSILAMAKRLDAASVISDPSFIEGASPHFGGVEPGGLGGGGGGRGNGNGRRGPGGLYDRDLDSIASESESSSSSSSSSDSSVERNPHRGKRPMGQPRVGFHDNNNNFRSNHHPRQAGPPGSYVGGRGGERMPPPPGNNSYAPSYQDNRGRQHNPGGPYIPDPGPPEYNTNNRNVRFSERGERRVYRDHEEGGGSSAQTPPRARSRSRSPNSRGSKKSTDDRSRGSRGSKKSADDRENDKREKRRRLKLIAIPIVVVIFISIAVVIAVVVGKGGKDDNASSSVDDTKFQISLPTTSPTYKGLYNCPYGTSGHVPMKGCVGYVTCNAFGEAVGGVIMCPPGTLYDVRSNVCNHVDQVQCSTRLPQLEDLEEAAASKKPPTPNPTPWPTPKPTMAGYEVQTPTEYAEISELLGPITTKGHKLAFIGVSSPGDMSSFQQNLENYLNIFYSPVNLLKLDEDDELRSLSDAIIEVTVTSVENRRLTGSDDANIPIPPNNIRGKQHRLQSFQLLQASEPKFIAIYDQITTYRTSDPFISVDTIVRRPFDPKYSATLVEHLQRRDPDTFSSLTDIEFVEGVDLSMPETITTTAPSKKPTIAPTKRPVETIETNEPTPFAEETSFPTQHPSPSPSGPVIQFPVVLTIQGLLWLDENANGLFEKSETPMEGLFVNLRECEKDRWKSTTTTNVIGQYQFVGIEEGEYYVDFFKPNPIERYEFTIPRVGGNDDTSLDSDVVILDANKGKSDCMEVKDGFKKLTNAGYLLKETPAPTPSPTPAPKPAPPKPSTSPTTAAPTVPRFCADVTGSGGNQEFDFRECSLPCESPQHEDCPDGMKCALTNDCT